MRSFRRFSVRFPLGQRNMQVPFRGRVSFSFFRVWCGEKGRRSSGKGLREGRKRKGKEEGGREERKGVYVGEERGVVYGGDKRTVKGEKEGINKSIKKRQEMIYIYTILCMP